MSDFWNKFTALDLRTQSPKFRTPIGKSGLEFLSKALYALAFKPNGLSPTD